VTAAPTAAALPRRTVLRGTGVDLRVRWLGTVPYREAWTLQQTLHADLDGRGEDRLLLLEHPPTYTLGRNAERAHVLVEPARVGAELLEVDRGGDVTFHGPGQLVAYPILTLPTKGGVTGGMPDTPGYVEFLEQVLIDALTALGLADVGRQDGCPGVWVEPNTPRTRKVAAIGVRIERGRSLHGIALNVTTDMGWFDHIVPCGIADKGVTSLAAEGLDVDVRAATDAFVAAFEHHWRPGRTERSDVVWRTAETDLAPFSAAGPGATTGSNAVPRRPAGRRTARRCGSGAAGRGGRGRVGRTHRPQARLDAGAGAPRRRSAPAEADRAGPGAGDGLRGGRLPQPLGVLVRGHGDVHGVR
jgi:lipoic acid synthetase